MERCDAVIVGSGPAGAATALHLVAGAAGRTGRVVLLDKARHPRDKTCAGGVIPKAVRLLERLGVGFEVPYAPVDRAGVAGEQVFTRRMRASVFRIVALDAAQNRSSLIRRY